MVEGCQDPNWRYCGGIYLDARGYYLRRPPLFEAIQRGNMEAVKELLKHPSVNINMTYGNCQHTPLSYSLQCQSSEIFDILMEIGADLGATTTV